MCWVALDRGCRLARDRGRRQPRSLVEDRREIRADILERGVSERGVFRQHYETDALDASTLLVPLVRFLPADDERVRNTVTAIADELTEDGLVLRYRVDETDDGLRARRRPSRSARSGSSAALSEIGERGGAGDCASGCSATRAPLGLYAEELDPKTAALGRTIRRRSPTSP